MMMGEYWKEEDHDKIVSLPNKCQSSFVILFNIILIIGHEKHCFEKAKALARLM